MTTSHKHPFLLSQLHRPPIRTRPINLAPPIPKATRRRKRILHVLKIRHLALRIDLRPRRPGTRNGRAHRIRRDLEGTPRRHVAPVAKDARDGKRPARPVEADAREGVNEGLRADDGPRAGPGEHGVQGGVVKG